MASILTGLGRWKEAVAPAEAMAGLDPSQFRLAALALVLQGAGERPRAARVARRAEALDATDWGAYTLAQYRALAGDRGLALRWLERSNDLGYRGRNIGADSLLATLRGDPAFERIRTQMSRRFRSGS